MDINDIYQSESGNNHFICKLTDEEIDFIIKNRFMISNESLYNINTLDYSFVVDPTGYLWETFMFGHYRIDKIDLPISVKKTIYRYKKLKRICEDDE